MPNDRYGTVGTGLGAGTGAGMVQVRYGYGTGTIHGYGRYGTWVRYMGTVFVPCTVPMYRTDRTRTMYPNSGRNSGRSAAISAAIWVHGTDFCRYLGTWYGYGRYGTWVRYMVRKPYPCTVPMYRTHVPYRPYPCIVPVPYPYRTCTVPAPVPAPKPVPTVPYPSKLLSKNPSAPYVMNPIENRVFIALEIS